MLCIILVYVYLVFYALVSGHWDPINKYYTDLLRIYTHVPGATDVLLWLPSYRCTCCSQLQSSCEVRVHVFCGHETHGHRICIDLSRLLLVLFFYWVVLIGVYGQLARNVITVDFLAKSGMLQGTQLILLYRDSCQNFVELLAAASQHMTRFAWDFAHVCGHLVVINLMRLGGNVCLCEQTDGCDTFMHTVSVLSAAVKIS